MNTRVDNARDVDGAGATLARDIEKTWRNWKAFIAEKRDELVAAEQDEVPEADLTGAGTRTVRRVAKLDAATRQQFGAVLEARRQQAQAKAEKEAREQGRPAPDADQVYAAILQHMQDELDGTIHPSGMALVWYKDALIKFDAQAVMAGTTDADYLASGSGSGPTKQQAALVLGVLAVLLIGLVFVVQWAFAEPVTPTMAITAARVGNQDAPLWTARAATVGNISVTATLGGSYPLTLCIDAAALKQVSPGATVILTGTAAIRRYQVQPEATGADLQLTNCNGGAMVGGARLVDTHTREALPAATLTTLSVRGPDLDPQAIPAGQMEVTLVIGLPDASAGALILADGRRWAPTTSAPAERGTVLTYLVPLAQTTQIAGWELERQDALPALLPLTLPAPEARASVLQRQLDIQAGVPTIIRRDGVAEIALDVTITLAADAAPLQLLPTDLLGTTDSAPIAMRWEPPILQPGQPQRVSVRVPIRSRDAVELALAAWRARITTE